MNCVGRVTRLGRVGGPAARERGPRGRGPSHRPCAAAVGRVGGPADRNGSVRNDRPRGRGPSRHRHEIGLGRGAGHGARCLNDEAATLAKRIQQNFEELGV